MNSAEPESEPEPRPAAAEQPEAGSAGSAAGWRPAEAGPAVRPAGAAGQPGPAGWARPAGRPEGSEPLRLVRFVDDRKPRRLAGLSLIHAVVHQRRLAAARREFPRSSAVRPILAAWPRSTALPLFHLYGDPPDDQAFDFIHVETIASRSSAHDWLIRAHRHRNLFQILLIERGGGEMTFEAATPRLRRAGRDPGAADHRARLPLSSRGHRRLGGELHRGRGRGARRTLRRGAEAAEGAGRRAGDSARRAPPRSSGCRRSAPNCTRRAFWRARAFAWRCAACWR